MKTEQLPSLILKTGKCYILRNGLVTEPLQSTRNNGTSYVFGAWVKEDCYPDKSFINWLVTGRAVVPEMEHEHEHDIVSEVEK